MIVIEEICFRISLFLTLPRNAVTILDRNFMSLNQHFFFHLVRQCPSYALHLISDFCGFVRKVSTKETLKELMLS